MSETYGRRRGRLAAAKVEPRKAVIETAKEYFMDRYARPKLSARAVRPDEPLTFEEEATSPLEAALWRAALAEQPVKKKRGRPRKKDAV